MNVETMEAVPTPDAVAQSIASQAERRFVYAMGRIEMRVPSIAIEREFSQAMGRDGTEKMSDAEAAHKVLSDRNNRYLVRQLCWVLSIEGIESYLLQPKDLADYDLLLTSLRAEPQASDIDIVVGELGPVSPPEMCNGISVPIVFFDQIYSFDRGSLIDSLPRPNAAKDEEQVFRRAAGELLNRIMQLAGNTGAADEHRAYNYLVARYPAVHQLVADAHMKNHSLTAVEARRSPLSSLRRIVDVVFSFRHRQTDVVEKSFVRVDVTEEFPFLVSKLSPYYDR